MTKSSEAQKKRGAAVWWPDLVCCEFYRVLVVITDWSGETEKSSGGRWGYYFAIVIGVLKAASLMADFGWWYRFSQREAVTEKESKGSEEEGSRQSGGCSDGGNNYGTCVLRECFAYLEREMCIFWYLFVLYKRKIWYGSMCGCVNCIQKY